MATTSRFSRSWKLSRRLSATSLVALAGCVGVGEEGPAVIDDVRSEVQGANLGGANLGGANLGGANLGGANLGGANLGGVNLGGANLGGANLGGANLMGNNLAGNNLSATNLGGANLGGANLGGANLGGAQLSATNLGGSTVAGTNAAGNSITGTTLLAASNLSGTASGRNIHNLSSASGMLYSGEDVWTPKSGACVVMGIGSTAFAKLLGQQSANAKINVALGKLPWGFGTSSGVINLRAWEAVVWGDKTYCVFVMAAPPATTWPGAAGFIKAVFRWQAPPAQSMDVSGIEASAPNDPTVLTTITTYTGMMDAAAKLRAGTITEIPFVAGELAFASATTNNQSVLVDFSSWVQDKNKNALVLGNVVSASPPTYAEALYIALDNGDGTVSVMLDDAASRAKVMPAGMTNSVVDLNNAYVAWQAGAAPKPVPRRCGGALYLKTWFGEPVPAGKCDDGLTWAPGFCVKGADPWSVVSGTTAPMNSYMMLTKSGGAYQRSLIAGNSCSTMKVVLSETYIHMWERNYDVTVSGSCTAESSAAFCARLGKNCGSVSGTDNCGNARTVSNCGSCASPNTCGGSGVPNLCGSTNSEIYEAEALGNTLSGSTTVTVCPEAYNKTIGTIDPSITAGACGGGAKLRFLGGSSSNYVSFNNVNVPAAGTYTLTIYAASKDNRTFYVSTNGGSATTVDMDGPDWTTPIAVTKNLTLNAGNNTIKLYNNSASTPDLDRIKVASTAVTICTPETDAGFCARAAKNCGAVSGNDNCGKPRSVASCGSCASPQTCGGGGEPNVCGGGASTTCAAPYAQSSCLTFAGGSTVSSGGHNWSCTTALCRQCAVDANCGPGGTACVYGTTWTDLGACTGGGGGNSSNAGACATPYNNANCIFFQTGNTVSAGGHNYTCNNNNCQQCATHPGCVPGATGCEWGAVWTDNGTCN